MKDDKNQIIRSMRSYATGGSTDDSCMETVMVNGRPKKKRKKGGCNSSQSFGKRSIPQGVKNVITGAAVSTAAILADKKYKLVDKAKEALGLKKGGSVKTNMKKK
tara:strand:- start:1604 stop:1918 length:315 start_codon:yes stop_codon:yes gene_type:complete